MLENLSLIINGCDIKMRVEDRWCWSPGDKQSYTINVAYRRLQQDKLGEQGLKKEEFWLIWNKLAPQKVKVHAWRVLWERIPTMVLLAQRNILPPNASNNCVFCTVCPETVRHVFFECDVTYRLWMLCLNWLGIESVLSSKPKLNLLHFSRLLKGKRGKEIAVCIWECMIWLIWKARNAIIFRNEQIMEKRIIDELKSRLWSWVVPELQGNGHWRFTNWSTSPRSLLNC